MARSVSVKVTILFNDFEKIARRMPVAAMEIIDETLDEMDRTVKAGMAASSSPSAPGAMPAVVSGALIGSLQHQIARGKYKGYYYTESDHAAFLEYGTTKMAARPFMTPAAERARPNFLRKFRNLESRLR